MDYKRVRDWQIFGFFFTAAVGTLLHFAYEWSGYSFWMGLFGAVNESIWEHTKLLLVPVIIFTAVEYFAYGRQLICFLPIKLESVVLGAVVIIAGYYTYTGVFGTEVMAVDVALFFVAAFVCYRRAYVKLLQAKECSPFKTFAAAIGLLAIAILIPHLTLNPPEIPLFRDMQTGIYGMYR